MTLPLKLLAYTASATLLLACLAPLASFANDAATLGSMLFQVTPSVSIQPDGRVHLRLTLTYNGNTPITGFTVRLRAKCGGILCAESSSQPTTLTRGAAITVEAQIPLTADTLELEAEGAIGGVYRLKASQEVALGVLRG